ETHERVELLAALAFARLTHHTGDGVTLAQPVAAHLGEGHVDVVRAGQVAGRAHERIVVEDVEDAGDRHEDVVLADHGLGFTAETLAALPRAGAAALTEPAAPTAAIELVVVAALPVLLILAVLLPLLALLALLVLLLIGPARLLVVLRGPFPGGVAVALGTVGPVAAIGPVAT